MASNKHRGESENASYTDKVVQLHSLPNELQGIIADHSVIEPLVDLSLPENLEPPTVALSWSHVYRTYYRFNTFLVPCVDKEAAKETLRKWIWEKLDSRMVEELVRSSIKPHLILEVAIIVDKMPHGPLYPMQPLLEVRIKVDPDSVSRLFELARKFQGRALQVIDIRCVLVTRREEQQANGEWGTKDTKAPVPEPVNTGLLKECRKVINRELIPLLETTNGVPSEAALTLADTYLPVLGPTWLWNNLIPTSPDVIKLYQDVAEDPAAKIPYALQYLQKAFLSRTVHLIHDGNIFISYYDVLLRASGF